MSDFTSPIRAESSRLLYLSEEEADTLDGARLAGLRLYWSRGDYFASIEPSRALLLALVERLATVEGERERYAEVWCLEHGRKQVIKWDRTAKPAKPLGHRCFSCDPYQIAQAMRELREIVNGALDHVDVFAQTCEFRHDDGCDCSGLPNDHPDFTWDNRWHGPIRSECIRELAAPLRRGRDQSRRVGPGRRGTASGARDRSRQQERQAPPSRSSRSYCSRPPILERGSSSPAGPTEPKLIGLFELGDPRRLLGENDRRRLPFGPSKRHLEGDDFPRVLEEEVKLRSASLAEIRERDTAADKRSLALREAQAQLDLAVQHHAEKLSAAEEPPPPSLLILPGGDA